MIKKRRKQMASNMVIFVSKGVNSRLFVNKLVRELAHNDIYVKYFSLEDIPRSSAILTYNESLGGNYYAYYIDIPHEVKTHMNHINNDCRKK